MRSAYITAQFVSPQGATDMEGCPVSPNDNTLHTDFHIFHSCWVGVIQICSLDSLISKQSQPPLQSGRILSLSPFRRGQGDGDKVSYCIFVCWAFTIFNRQHLTAAMWKIPRRFSLSVSLTVRRVLVSEAAC